jgi:hypothetical protein
MQILYIYRHLPFKGLPKYYQIGRFGKTNLPLVFADDEDFEPPTASGGPTDKWEGEDSDDDKIKEAWDAGVS